MKCIRCNLVNKKNLTYFFHKLVLELIETTKWNSMDGKKYSFLKKRKEEKNDIKAYDNYIFF